MNTIDPRGFDVIEWTDRMNTELTGIGIPPRVLKEDDWTEWALSVIQFPKIAAVQAPDPRSFTDWKEWAFRFNQTIYGLT